MRSEPPWAGRPPPGGIANPSQAVAAWDSDALHRASVAATAVVSILALGVQRPGGLLLALVASTLCCLAHWVSWRRRGRRSYRVVFALAVAMLACLGLFLGLNWSRVLDPLTTVAFLFASLGIVQSFYLPSRKDVEDALLAPALTMMAAATYSQELLLGPFLLLFVVAIAGALILGRLEECRVAAGLVALPVTEAWRLARPHARLLPLLLLLAAASWLALPRNLDSRRERYPASTPAPIDTDLGGAIYNPIYPGLSAAAAPFDGRDENGRRIPPDPFRSDGYFGLASYMDLSYRGQLSDELMMRVRATEPAYWRALNFDTYDGHAWRMSEQNARPLPAREFSIDLPRSREDGPLDREAVRLVQTFTILRPSSNALFAAYRASELYFPARRVYIDPYGSLRSPSPLAPGTVYTVVSQRYPAVPDRLRSAPAVYPASIAGPYLQLPEIPQRVHGLARDLASPHDNAYDRVLALQRYLEATYPYQLDIPVPDQDADTVDWFLFEQRSGFCEMYASALVVMLRSVGIPARLVAGYASGQYNPITGYYEVRARDAHAWADVYFPGYGWLAFDPTPGDGASEEPGQRSRWVLPRLAPYLTGALGIEALWSWAQQRLESLAGIGQAVPSWAGIPVVLLGGVAVSVGGALFLSSRRKGATPASSPLFPRRRIAAAYWRWRKTLTSPGSTGPTGITARCLLLTLPSSAEAAELTALFERACWSPAEPSPLDARRADDLSLHLLDARRPGAWGFLRRSAGSGPREPGGPPR